MTESSRPMDLSSEKATSAINIVRTLSDAGFEALFAGGCIRDHLLGFLPKDFDIATSATPDQVEKLFPKTIPVGRQFGVMLVLMKDIPFEVATFRTEGGYQDGRHPGFVNFSNSREDASRRDFTVNGLFYDPLKHQVIDYVGGQEDLSKRVIRCIGNPSQRFEEDKLRLLRAIRFATRLQFKIDPATWEEVKKRASQISSVSKERIREELDKIFVDPHAGEGIRMLQDSGLWKELLPSVSKISPFLGLSKRSIPLACAALFFDHARAEINTIMKDLRYSNEMVHKTQHIIDLTNKLIRFSDLRGGEFAQICHDADYENALILYSAALSMGQANHLPQIQKAKSDWDNRPYPAPFLNGDDLKAIGILPGPNMKKILDEAYLQQLEGKLSDKNAALSWARSQK